MGSPHSYEATIARGAGFVLAGTVVSTGLAFVIRTFLIRQLPAGKYGLFALALTVGGAITTLSTLGLKQGVARTVPRCETESEVRDVTLTAITSTLFVSLLFSGVLLGFSDPLATRILREEALAPYLRVVGALVPGMTIQAVVIATFRGKKRVYERIVVRNLISPIGRLALVVGAVLLGYGAFGALIAWTIGIGIATLLGLYYLYRRTTTFSLAAFEPRFRTLLVFSLPLMISSTTWTVVQQADNLLLGFFATSVEVGIYDGAFLLARLLLIVLGSFGFLFMPIFSELEAAGKVTRMQEVYTSVTEWAALLVLPLFVAMVLGGETILTILFKDSYAVGATSLMLIATGFYVHVLSGSSGNALVALGRTKLVMGGNVVAGLLNILLNIVLIPRFGIIGAAGASAGTYALFNLLFLYWLNRETGIVPFSRSFFRPILGSSALLGVIWLIAEIPEELGFLALLSILALTYLLHGVIVLKTKRVTRGDKQLLSRLDAAFEVDVRRLIGLLR